MTAKRTKINTLPYDTFVDIKLAEEDTPLIDGDELTEAGEIYLADTRTGRNDG